MAGLRAVVVGYRKDDRRRLRLVHEHGIASVPVKRCASCGYPTFFVASGQDAYMQRDPEVLCDPCYQRHKDQVVAEL